MSATAAYPHLATIAAIARKAGLAPADPIRQPLAEARAKARAYQALWNTELPDVHGIAHTQTTSDRGTPINLHIYYPDARRSKVPTLIYFHGGGFALNGIDTHERLIRLLALRGGVAVMAVSYTLAPELRYPGQLQEALAAYDWLARHGADFGLDARSAAVGGDSAGANLALALTLALRDLGRPLPGLGLLFYGMFSADLDTPSHRSFGGGAFGLTTERMDWFWDQYLADETQRADPLAAPLLADLHGLPPQVLIGAGLDCLLDDTLNLARNLEQAGIAHSLTVYDGVPHSFMQMSAQLPPADQAIWEAATALRGLFSHNLALAAE